VAETCAITLNSDSGFESDVVMLKVRPQDADRASGALSLCPPLRIDFGGLGNLWVSPGCWIVFGDAPNGECIEAYISQRLDEVLHHTVDVADGLSVLSVSGPLARTVLSSGCGLDLRPGHYEPGTCCRTRFAKVGVFVASVSDDQFRLIADSSCEEYLLEWLRNAAEISEA